MFIGYRGPKTGQSYLDTHVVLKSILGDARYKYTNVITGFSNVSTCRTLSNVQNDGLKMSRDMTKPTK